MNTNNKNKFNIIIEGVDRSGKSTLSDFLMKQFDMNYVHFTADETQTGKTDYLLKLGNRVYDQFENFLDTKFEKNKSNLFDRMMYSDYVYGPIYKNFEKPITLQEIRNLESKLDKYNTVVIFCESFISTNWKLIQEEGKSEMDFDTLVKFRLWYNMALEKSILPVFKYNFEVNTFSDVLDFIRRETNKN